MMGPNPNGPCLVSCNPAMRYSGFSRDPWTVGPVGDFLEGSDRTDRQQVVGDWREPRLEPRETLNRFAGPRCGGLMVFGNFRWK